MAVTWTLADCDTSRRLARRSSGRGNGSCLPIPPLPLSSHREESMPKPAAEAPTVAVRAPEPPKHGPSIELVSESIENGGKIALEHAFTGCGGKNISPQLSW